jgi:hypothetical protein
VTRPRFDLGTLIEIDLRSLALFRIGVALTVLVDLAARVRDLDAFYGPSGVLPPELATKLWGLRAAASPFTWVAAWPSLLWVGVALLAIAAVCLALGVVPRLAAGVTWALLAALQDRNPALYMSGDRYLLLLLMWCAVLPTGARLSLRPAPPGVTRIRSWASAGLLFQVLVVYLVTGLKKTGAEWFDGTALWYALSFDEWVTTPGRWLRSHAGLLVPMSFAVKWVETLGPLLVLSPWRNAAARMTAVGLFWALHLGLQTFQTIGVFQLVGLVAWLAFVPAALWDRGSARESTGQEAPSPRWAEGLALIPIAYLIVVLAWTVSGVVVRGTPYPVPASVDRIAVPLHLQEGWAMFASFQPTRYWLLAPGSLADGSKVEVLRRGQLDWSRPSDLQSAQRGFRWTLYLVNTIKKGVLDPTFREVHPAMLEYLCRDWNARAEPTRRLQRVELMMVLEPVLGPGIAGPPEGERYLVAARDCPRAGL